MDAFRAFHKKYAQIAIIFERLHIKARIDFYSILHIEYMEKDLSCCFFTKSLIHVLFQWLQITSIIPYHNFI